MDVKIESIEIFHPRSSLSQNIKSGTTYSKRPGEIYKQILVVVLRCTIE